MTTSAPAGGEVLEAALAEVLMRTEKTTKPFPKVKRMVQSIKIHTAAFYGFCGFIR